MAEENRINGPSDPMRTRQTAAARRTAAARAAVEQTAAGASFADVLRRQQAATEPLRFSGHAQARMASRGVALTQTDLARLSDGVGRAAERGGKESLVLMDDLALVVSVRNRTVITVMDGESRKDSVFTNIDSAVIV
jgi:flagellar operon protein